MFWACLSSVETESYHAIILEGKTNRQKENYLKITVSWKEQKETHQQVRLWTCQQKLRQRLAVSCRILLVSAVWAVSVVHSPPSVHWSSECSRCARIQTPAAPLKVMTGQNKWHPAVSNITVYRTRPSIFFLSPPLKRGEQKCLHLRLVSLSLSWSAECLSSYDLHSPVACSKEMEAFHTITTQSPENETEWMK